MKQRIVICHLHCVPLPNRKKKSTSAGHIRSKRLVKIQPESVRIKLFKRRYKNRRECLLSAYLSCITCFSLGLLTSSSLQFSSSFFSFCCILLLPFQLLRNQTHCPSSKASDLSFTFTEYLLSRITTQFLHKMRWLSTLIFSEAIFYGIKVFLLLSCDFLICVVLMKISIGKKSYSNLKRIPFN